MVYEWDERKARRDYLLKMLFAVGFAVAVASVPTWFLSPPFPIE
ncbi:hypothetical protein ACVJBD_007273 [Rhizobium mongolense]